MGLLSLFRHLDWFQWLGLLVFASMILAPTSFYIYMAVWGMRPGAAGDAGAEDGAEEVPFRDVPADARSRVPTPEREVAGSPVLTGARQTGGTGAPILTGGGAPPPGVTPAAATGPVTKQSAPGPGGKRPGKKHRRRARR